MNEHLLLVSHGIIFSQRNKLTLLMNEWMSFAYFLRSTQIHQNTREANKQKTNKQKT